MFIKNHDYLDIFQYLRLFVRFPGDPPHEHLSAVIDLIESVDFSENVGEVAVLAHVSLPGEAKQHFILRRFFV